MSWWDKNVRAGKPEVYLPGPSMRSRLKAAVPWLLMFIATVVVMIIYKATK